MEPIGAHTRRGSFRHVGWTLEACFELDQRLGQVERVVGVRSLQSLSSILVHLLWHSESASVPLQNLRVAAAPPALIRRHPDLVGCAR